MINPHNLLRLVSNHITELLPCIDLAHACTARDEDVILHNFDEAEEAEVESDDQKDESYTEDANNDEENNLLHEFSLQYMKKVVDFYDIRVLHPSTLVFNELIRTYTIPGNYHPTMAEQEFLNQFFRLRYLQLPTIYNMNMAVYSTKQYLWETLKSDFKIVHFTIRKPFMLNGKNRHGYKDVYKLYDEIYEDFLHNTNIDLIKTLCHIIV